MRTRTGLSLMVAIPLLASGCQGDQGDTGAAGEIGAAGVSCTVNDNGDGTKLISCEDGTAVTVSDGDGCTVTENAGIKTVTCEDGTSVTFTNGDSCTAVNNTDGSVTIVCEDGSAATIFNQQVSEFVGAQSCQICHPTEYDEVYASGHPYKLNYIGGEVPDPLPNDSLLPDANFPADPPAGYAWSDISYIIGGWAWKARFMDMEGYIITCPKGDDDTDSDGCCESQGAWNATDKKCDARTFKSQWNLYHNESAPYPRAEWVNYHGGEYQRKYNCGRCHTTGFNPEIPTPGMPGIVGSWAEDGITCEACHGPLSKHELDPYGVPAAVDRSAEMCGKCHIRDGADKINAKGGFIRHHEQWDEMFQSKKHSMDCIDCHNAHLSSKYDVDIDGDTTGDNPSLGIHVACESCHWDKVGSKGSLMDSLPAAGAGRPTDGVMCIECHMPKASKSALAFGPHEGDVSTHIFSINPEPTAEQFEPDGKNAKPYLTTTFSCQQCHKDCDDPDVSPCAPVAGAPQPYSGQNNDALRNCATRYHDPVPGDPQAGLCATNE